MAHPSLELRGLELVQSLESVPRGLYAIGWSPDGTAFAATGTHGVVAVWSEGVGQPRLLRGHSKSKDVLALAWHPRRQTLATASLDGTVRLWNVDTGRSRVFCRLDEELRGVAWSPGGPLVALTDKKGGIGVWDAEEGDQLLHARVHNSFVNRPCWSPDGRLLVTGSGDKTINVQTSHDLQLVHRLRGHNDIINDIALSPDGGLIASASRDATVRVWDLHRGTEIAVLEGHSAGVVCVRFSPDGDLLASGSPGLDPTVRLWRCRDWECVAVLPRHGFDGIGGLDFHPLQPLLAAKDKVSQRIDYFRIDYDLLRDVDVRPDSRRYVNAKVVLLGDTGVGKSGLGLVLSGHEYRPTDSTHGRNVWTFGSPGGRNTRAGQPDQGKSCSGISPGNPAYRLVHQLHLNEVAVALVVFDSRSETDPFAGVKHWVRALAQARRLEGARARLCGPYLVAARADRGGFGGHQAAHPGDAPPTGPGRLLRDQRQGRLAGHRPRAAIRDGIDWDALPMVSY